MNASSGSPQWAETRAGSPDFVTITAWIFIGLSAASTLMSALQNVVLSFAFSPASGFPIQEAQRHMPPAFAFLFAHMRVYFSRFCC